jgi:hypothetical protein
MLHAFLNLLAHSWDALIKATGTTTLGFVLWTLAVIAVSWASTVAEKWLRLKRAHSTEPFLESLRGSLWLGVFSAGGVTILVAFVFVVFVVRTIYGDHERLVQRNEELTAHNRMLSEGLEWRKHNVSTTDAVFPNLIYLLQAFQIYRGAQSGRPCVLWITATSDSAALASVVAQFSNSVSGCFTIGPVSSEIPDLDDDVMDGMVPGVIVLHAPRDDTAADQLQVHLGNQIQVRRSYKSPRTPKTRLYSSVHQYKESFIWLQFGTNVKWNSELIRKN